jgi:membrane protein YdbS with pleckstrin-like domain
MKKISKKAIAIWIIRNFVLNLFVLAPFILLCIFVPDPYHFPVVLTYGIFYAIVSFFCFVWPFLTYSHYSYCYTEKRIVIHRGVIFRHEIVIPVIQVQDLHIYETPRMLLFKTSGVEISTAGSNFSILCMEKEDASKMVEDLEANLTTRIEDLLHE